jgi:hypothetical protein
MYTHGDSDNYTKMLEDIKTVLDYGPEGNVSSDLTLQYRKAKTNAISSIKKYLEKKHKSTSNENAFERRDGAVLACAMIDPVSGEKLANTVNRSRENNKKIHVDKNRVHNNKTFNKIAKNAPAM